MVRTQIQLTDAQAARVKRLARQRGVSMATVIREAIDRLEDAAEERREEVWQRAMSVVGKYRGHGGNLSEEHDEELARAYEDWR